MNCIFDASDPSIMMVRTENQYAKETSKLAQFQALEIHFSLPNIMIFFS